MSQSKTSINSNNTLNRRQTSVDRCSHTSVAAEPQSGVPDVKPRWHLHQSNVDDPVGAQPVHQAGDGRKDAVDCRRRGDVVPPTPPLRCGAKDHHLTLPRPLVRRRPHPHFRRTSCLHCTSANWKKKKHKLISWRVCTHQSGFHAWKKCKF